MTRLENAAQSGGDDARRAPWPDMRSGGNGRSRCRRRRDLQTPREHVHGSPNAKTFFAPLPANVPLPQYTMPSEIDGPALHGVTCGAGGGSGGGLLSNAHLITPVVASMAYIMPMRLQPNTTSFVAA